MTARKIAEDPQDVPMSVQVLSGEYLDESRTTRLHELQFAIPGLVVNTIGMFGVGLPCAESRTRASGDCRWRRT